MRKIKLTDGGSWIDRKGGGRVVAGRPGAEVGASDHLANRLVADGQAVEVIVPIDLTVKPDSPPIPIPGPKPKAERKPKRGLGRKRPKSSAPATTTDDMGD